MYDKIVKQSEWSGRLFFTAPHKGWGYQLQPSTLSWVVTDTPNPCGGGLYKKIQTSPMLCNLYY